MQENAANSQVGETVNYLLQEALEMLGIKKREAMTWTNLRHTAFVLMIEDNPDLRETSELIDFAKNGFTSLDQFQKTYLDKMDIQRRASESRKKVKAGKYDLIKRLDDFNQVVDWENSSFYQTSTENFNKA